MGNHQDTSNRHARVQVASADSRISQLHNQGHHVNVDSGNDYAIATITRREGFAHHVTFTPDILPAPAREGAAFKRYPQTVLIAYAIDTIANWSAEIDTRCTMPCLGCGRHDNTKANFNQQTAEYDWFCPTCFYGAYPEDGQ